MMATHRDAQATPLGLIPRYSYFPDWLGALALLVLYLLSRTLQKQISKPIVRLAVAVRAVSEHADYSVRAAKLGNDEL